MYKISVLEDTVRIPPKRFGEKIEDVIISELDNTILGKVDKNVGIILAPI